MKREFTDTEPLESRWIPCGACHGSGWIDAGECTYQCATCYGTGRREITKRLTKAKEGEK